MGFSQKKSYAHVAVKVRERPNGEVDVIWNFSGPAEPKIAVGARVSTPHRSSPFDTLSFLFSQF